MKRRVTLDRRTVVKSVLIILLIVLFFTYRYFRTENDYWPWALLGLMTLLAFGILFYAPASVSADDNALTVHRLIRETRIPYSSIASVKPCTVMAASNGPFSSGGLFGYWGKFKDERIGPFFGYYGKPDQCFLVRLKNGKAYVIGCDDSAAILAHIQSHLNSRDLT